MATNQELTECFERIQSGLYKRMLMLVKNHYEAEEIVQQSFLMCWKYKKKENIKELDKWIFRVCYNCMKDYLKSK